MSYADYLRLNPQDQVAIACRDLEPGTPLENSTCQDLIPAGHKVALAAIASGESVRRYGQIIGIASRAIAPGQHVHVHNLAMGETTVITASETIMYRLSPTRG
jgi:arabinonate dehydratase